MANNNPRRSAGAPAKRGTGRAPFYAALVTIAVVGAGVLLYLARNPSAGSGASDESYQALVRNYQNAGPPQPYTLGDPKAPVTVEEFADYECPSCGRFATITEPDVRSRLIQTGRVYYKYYDFPLPMHRNSQPASNAAACAAEQGKFWEMHDQLYAGQAEWGLGPGETEVTTNVRPIFLRYAQAVGLDTDRWGKCFDERKYQGRVNANLAEALRRKLEQTPTFFVNGKMVAGAITYDDMQRLVDDAARAVPPAGSAASPTAPPSAPVPADTAGIAPRKKPAPAGP